MAKSDSVYAVILAGGSGERFWPASTPDRPKQFLELFGGVPLIRQAVDRVAGLIPPERVIVITAAKLVPLTRRVLPAVPRANIVGEPCRRDTAAAMATAVSLVKRLGGPGAVACMLTSDQLISPAAKFRRVLSDAAKVARETDSVVTIGIRPTFPATGFGYIERGGAASVKTRTAFSTVRRFVEKPDAATARRYLRTGRYCWNSGMFIWRVEVLERLFRKHAADIAALIDPLANAKNVNAVMKRMYPGLRKISFDYAVMERTKEILVAEGDFDWDDVGTWTALRNHFAGDGAGNIRLGNVKTLEVSGSIAVSDDHLLAVFGLDDVVAVHTPEATLVCAKSRVQELKRLLAVIDGGR